MLVNIFKIAFKCVYSVSGVFLIDRVVPIKHCPGAVTRYFHDYRPLDTDFSHVGVERVTEIMENESSFFEPTVNYSGFFTGVF